MGQQHYADLDETISNLQKLEELQQQLETLKAKVREYLIADEDEDREQDPSEKLRGLAKELWELVK